jgi:hypothetical protein
MAHAPLAVDRHDIAHGREAHIHDQFSKTVTFAPWGAAWRTASLSALCPMLHLMAATDWKSLVKQLSKIGSTLRAPSCNGS